ncbi:hypothetical protein LR48_Vigan11g055000 [Vigna angularis]|uniref:Uncharacterized protein n=1 Tax=Phaseolus angularis TaxID=3914 RepID=A0A0L9VRP0_PHAAN|nr:hypothetical protein LR48_Vigan11g055000 [Vigna angularis]
MTPFKWCVYMNSPIDFCTPLLKEMVRRWICWEWFLRDEDRQNSIICAALHLEEGSIAEDDGDELGLSWEQVVMKKIEDNQRKMVAMDKDLRSLATLVGVGKEDYEKGNDGKEEDGDVHGHGGAHGEGQCFQTFTYSDVGGCCSRLKDDVEDVMDIGPVVSTMPLHDDTEDDNLLNVNRTQLYNMVIPFKLPWRQLSERSEDERPEQVEVTRSADERPKRRPRTSVLSEWKQEGLNERSDTTLGTQREGQAFSDGPTSLSLLLFSAHGLGRITGLDEALSSSSVGGPMSALKTYTLVKVNLTIRRPYVNPAGPGINVAVELHFFKNALRSLSSISSPSHGSILSNCIVENELGLGKWKEPNILVLLFQVMAASTSALTLRVLWKFGSIHFSHSDIGYVDRHFVAAFQNELGPTWSLLDNNGHTHVVTYNMDTVNPRITNGWGQMRNIYPERLNDSHISFDYVGNNNFHITIYFDACSQERRESFIYDGTNYPDTSLFSVKLTKSQARGSHLVCPH